jgi:hypothetical protein
LVLLLATWAAQARGDEPGYFLGRSGAQWHEQLASASGPARQQAAWAIAQLAGRLDAAASAADRAVGLGPLLAHQDASVRYWAALGLGWLAEGQAPAERLPLTAGLEQLLADSSPAPRLAAAEALAKAGARAKALPVLLDGLKSPQEAVRIQAAASLERLGNDPEAQAALRASRQDDSEYVKRISESATRAAGSR